MLLETTMALDTDELKTRLEGVFPSYRVKYAPLNKKTLRIVNGMNQVVVGQQKNGKLICAGNINMLDLRILIPFVVLLAAFVITGIVFIVIMMQVKKKEYRAMEAEIGQFLTKHYN